ncbi:MAG: hypothetical protein AMJ75_00515 [Phycisphaerae bacterium SM1_79]|nr:MAG: hypothetical protein AMJ75_00515 [Phycisphaerae bacterium SM1_79]
MPTNKIICRKCGKAWGPLAYRVESHKYRRLKGLKHAYQRKTCEKCRTINWKQIKVRFRPRDAEILRREAKELNITVAELIRSLYRIYVKQKLL